jgi:hypothetical protein
MQRRDLSTLHASSCPEPCGIGADVEDACLAAPLPACTVGQAGSMLRGSQLLLPTETVSQQQQQQQPQHQQQQPQQPQQPEPQAQQQQAPTTGPEGSVAPAHGAGFSGRESPPGVVAQPVVPLRGSFQQLASAVTRVSRPRPTSSVFGRQSGTTQAEPSHQHALLCAALWGDEDAVPPCLREGPLVWDAGRWRV